MEIKANKKRKKATTNHTLIILKSEAITLNKWKWST